MVSIESINPGMEPEGEIKSIEAIKTPEQSAIEEFDAETRRLQARKHYFESKITDLQEKAADPTDNVSSVSGGAMAESREELQQVEKELRGREPSLEEVKIQEEIDGLEQKRLRIKKGEETGGDTGQEVAVITEKKNRLEALKLARIQKYEGMPQKKGVETKEEAPQSGTEEEKLVQKQEVEEIRTGFLKTKLEKYLEQIKNNENIGEADQSWVKENFLSLTGRNFDEELDQRMRQEVFQEQSDYLSNKSGAYGEKRIQAIREKKRQEAIIAEGKKYGELKELQRGGILISEAAFLQLIKNGIDIKKAGFFSGLMGKAATVVENGRPRNISSIELKNLRLQKEQEFEKEAKEEFEKEIAALKEYISNAKKKYTIELMSEAINSAPSETEVEQPAIPASEDITENITEENPESVVPEVIEGQVIEPAQEDAKEMAKEEIKQEPVPEITIKDLKKNEAMDLRIELRSKKKVEKLMESIGSYGSKIGLNQGEVKYLKSRAAGGKQDASCKGLEKIEAFGVAVKFYEMEYVNILLERIKAKVDLYNRVLSVEAPVIEEAA